jgi:hypothetical protein
LPKTISRLRGKYSIGIWGRIYVVFIKRIEQEEEKEKEKEKDLLLNYDV